jgi:5-methylthioribose kinase
MGRYVARLAFGTSVFGLEAQTVKGRTAEAVNPELCQITEDLVFTEPYLDHPHNSYVPALAEAVALLRADDRLTTGVQALKYAFMTRAEALIHGDLHTGSVMVSPGAAGAGARAIDPEFCFYGPVGFDLGALFGNYLIARVRAEVLGRAPAFRDWLRCLPDSTWSAFEGEMRRQWPARSDPWLSDRFLDNWLRQVFSDCVGFGGCKAIRRIIGLAKVTDIQSLEGAAHVRAARAVLLTARCWIAGREEVRGPAELIAMTDAALAEALAAPV